MPSTGDGASSEVQQQLPVTTTAKIDHNHPLFIHPLDIQSSVLISIQLLGLWKLIFVEQIFKTCVTWKKQAVISTWNM